MLVLGSTPLPLAVMAIKQTLQAVVFAWLVLKATNGFGGVAGRLLSWPPVVYVGRVSYGVYLVHGLTGEILAALGISSRALPEPLRLLVLSAVTVGIASLSWHLLEAPLNRLKQRFPYVAEARYGLRRPLSAEIAP
jgi:peptidoglycan/LPS O-acetylase OafA/YrhL